MARRLDAEHFFQFTPDLELAAARAELNQSHLLDVSLATLKEKFGNIVPELSGEYYGPCSQLDIYQDLSRLHNPSFVHRNNP